MALSHLDRVCQIGLVLTNSIIGSFAEMTQKPFLALKQFYLTSKDDNETPVRSELLGGSAPLLRKIELHGIAVPFLAMRRLLLSTTDLVGLRIDNIPNTSYFSPNALVAVLSSLAQLKKLLIDFCFPLSRARSVTSRAPVPPLKRTILPSLDNLYFHVASEYAEELCAMIDTPALATVGIKLFNQLIFEIPQVWEFISRMKGLRSFDEVIIEPYDTFIPVKLCFREKNKRDDGWCILTVSRNQLDWQLSFATQILNQLSPFLSGVKTLSVYRHRTVPMATGKEDVDPTQWLELFQSLHHLPNIDINEEELVPDVVQALVGEDEGYRAAELLPSLRSLSLKKFYKSPSVKEASERFQAAPWAAGRGLFLSG